MEVVVVMKTDLKISRVVKAIVFHHVSIAISTNVMYYC